MTRIDAPVIETERLILRAPVPEDFEGYAAFFADERSKGMGRPLDRHQAWRAFAMEMGHWIFHGYGLWTVTDRETGAALGRCGLYDPEGWLEPELGWALHADAEGRGIAYEAASAVRRYAYEEMGRDRLISCIAPFNARSIALAERLGATHERDWTSPSGRQAQIWRHPSRAELNLTGETHV